jgi:hypothetical protein
MLKFSRLTILLVFMVSVLVGLGSSKALAESCQPKQDILGLPTWYKFLDGRVEHDVSDPTIERCVPLLSCEAGDGEHLEAQENCKADSNVDASKIWLIGLAIIEIMLRLGGIMAIGFIIYGGYKYILSQGEPDKTKGARQTIVNAFIGLIITILASVSVNFLAKVLQTKL